VSDVLTELLNAGLLDRLDGDDARFAKLERAAHAIADHLHAHPRELVQAVLAGLDPDIAPGNPSIQLAKRMLQAEWKSVTSVYPSEPVELLRAILLAACSELAEKHPRDASILWLTAADTLPLRRLGKEETVVRRLLIVASKRTEEAAGMATVASSDDAHAPDVEELASPEIDTENLHEHQVDRTILHDLVAAAAGPNDRKGRALKKPNPHSPHNQPTEWSYEFTDRMSALIADTTDEAVAAVHASIVKIAEWQKLLDATVTAQSDQQQERVKSAIAAMSASRGHDQVRLDALWWSEALYSDVLQCSYRELDPALAAVLMALELEKIVPSPPPASVGYLLAETVHRLPDASFDRKEPLSGVLATLARARDRLPSDWVAPLCEVPGEGSVSVRDVVMLTLSGQDPAVSLKRAGIMADQGCTLPHLAHAVFRQQHAVRLTVEGT